MLQLICKIDFEQVTPWNGQSRSMKFSFDFVNDVDIEDSWESMTNTCRITIPRKLYFKSNNGQLYTMDGRDAYANTVTSPIFMRGDKVRVYLGYIYPSVSEPFKYKKQLNLEFDGYITRVNPKTPIVLDCEDAMWLLKQITAPHKEYLGSKYDVGQIIRDMVGSKLPENYTIRDSAQTKFSGQFYAKGDTVAECLQRLKKEAYIFPYIRRITDKVKGYRYELRVSSLVYYPEDQRDIVINEDGTANEILRLWTFSFQNNVVDSDGLVYQRKDDINVRVVAKSYYDVTESGKNKHKTLTVTVPDDAPADSEIRTLNFYGISDPKKLKEYAQNNMNRFYYDGYKGEIVVFGLPSVRHGDLIKIIDNKYRERNGIYLCKGVKKSFGVRGFQQTISLDMKVYDIDVNGNKVSTELSTLYNNTGL